MEKIEKFDDYQKLAMLTKKEMESKQKQLEYAVLSLSGEVGELANLLKKKVYHNKPGIDNDAFIDEASDVLWYLSCLADALGITLSEIATFNIEKLKKRYNSSSYDEAHYTKNS